MAAIESGRVETAPAGAPRARPWVDLAARLAGRLGHGRDRTRGGSRAAVAARRIGSGAVRDNAGGGCAPTDQRVCRRDREHGRHGRERDANRLARARAAVRRVSAGPGSRDVCRVRHLRRRAGPSRSRRSSADMKSIHLRLAAVVAAIVLVERRDMRARRKRRDPGSGPTSP